MLSAYREFITAAPRELNGFFAFASVPPGPPFPEELHLRKVSGIVWCYVGGEEDAAKAMAPLLDNAPGAAHARGRSRCRIPALQSVFDGAVPARRPVVLARRLRQGDPRRGGRRRTRSTAPRCRPGSRPCTCIRSTARYTIVGPTDTAWSYRDATWGAVFAGVDPDPANVDQIRDWTVDYFDALHPYSAGGAYVNMMMDEGQERVRASYRDNYDRLARIKRQYDPDNLFRVNQNIKPAAPGS